VRTCYKAVVVGDVMVIVLAIGPMIRGFKSRRGLRIVKGNKNPTSSEGKGREGKGREVKSAPIS
jgi:hypothetical protein